MPVKVSFFWKNRMGKSQPMRRVSLLSALISCLSVFWICFEAGAMPALDPSAIPAAPDYTKDEGWLARPRTADMPVDVFYVYPTVLFNDSDWMMDTKKPSMRKAAEKVLATQASVFDGQANIYAPMYRQMNFAGFDLSHKDEAPMRKIGHDDVWRAFEHYLKYENGGRPFFLAGHSQGSMILADLMVKNWGTVGAEDRLVAALLLGWSITSDDLASNPSLAMCDSAERTGCIISYNTMAAGRQSEAPTLFPGALTVNPLSWRMDGVYVPKEKNLGATFFDTDHERTVYPHFTSAQIVDGGLIVQPENAGILTVKEGHLPFGVFHAFDFALFFENLKANIARRIAAF